MILFLPGQYPFCYHHRGYTPGIYSNQMVVSDFMRKDMKYSAEAIKAQSDIADIIVFQRPSYARSLELGRALKAKGKKIIFENDDTYEGLPLERLDNEKQRQIAKEQANNLREFLKMADGAIASTKILAEEYKRLNPNVAVLKNCIDPLDQYECKENTTGKFRIGFIGSVTSNDDYFHIKDQIKKLDERGDITIVVLGVKYQDGTHLPVMQEDFNFWNSLKNIEWQPYVHVTEYMMTLADLALDLAVIPRKEHYFNQCKSNLKFLEMSLLKIPVLAQGFSDGTSPYQGVDEPYLNIVMNNDEWYNNIVEIKDNYLPYEDKAIKAHQYVLDNYDITNNYAQEWVNTINNLCKFQKNY